MLIVANFKMNGSKKFFAKIQNKLNDLKFKDTIILCPPFVYMGSFNLTNKKIALGSQDICLQENDRSTGQISPQMLKEFKVKYSLVGHSERRVIGETDDMIAQKAAVALRHNIVPIVCVGEQSKNNLQQIKNQTSFVLKWLTENFNSSKAQTDLNKIIFAYEPVWAIGTHHLASNQQIDQVAKLIKAECKKFNLNCKVLYGGSIDGENYNTLKNCAIDGFLLCKAAQNLNEFLKIIEG